MENVFLSLLGNMSKKKNEIKRAHVTKGGNIQARTKNYHEHGQTIVSGLIKTAGW